MAKKRKYQKRQRNNWLWRVSTTADQAVRCVNEIMLQKIEKRTSNRAACCSSTELTSDIWFSGFMPPRGPTPERRASHRFLSTEPEGEKRVILDRKRLN